MGTNYYIEFEVCECCKRGVDPLHIGKSSGGWCFSLHVYPEDWQEWQIKNLDDWKALLAKPRTIIKDEYERIITLDEMIDIITNRSWPKGHEQVSAQWYKSNHAEPGPNGLARHKIEPSHCIGHGEGTYDYIIGEFS